MRGLFWVLVTALTAAVQAEEAAAEYKTVQAQALAPDGKPAAERKVLLLGVNRNCFMTDMDRASKLDGWNFTTDADGRIRVQLGRFLSADREAKTKRLEPGWGAYFLVALPSETDAGGVSARLVNFPDDQPTNNIPEDEWGKPQILGQGINETVIQLKAGITVTGNVQDTNGKAATDLAVSLSHDLRADKQEGSDLFYKEAKTDRNGFFEFKNVLPVKFYIGLAHPPPYWIQTRVGSQWQDGIMDEFDVPPKTREMLLGMAVSGRKLYGYYGQIKDDKGRSVENARVTFGISMHRKPRTDEDTHTFQEVMTRTDGRFDIKTETPWIWSIQIESPSHETLVKQAESEAFRPGVYNFTLRRKR